MCLISTNKIINCLLVYVSCLLDYELLEVVSVFYSSVSVTFSRMLKDSKVLRKYLFLGYVSQLLFVTAPVKLLVTFVSLLFNSTKQGTLDLPETGQINK